MVLGRKELFDWIGDQVTNLKNWLAADMVFPSRQCSCPFLETHIVRVIRSMARWSCLNDAIEIFPLVRSLAVGLIHLLTCTDQALTATEPVVGLKPLLKADPEVRIYSVN